MAASVGYVLAQLQRWTSPGLAETPDAVLLERFRLQRDESAFTALMARYGSMVLRCCRRVLGDVHEAEDAFQATFLILARKAHSLRQPAALPGFLHSVARRVAHRARAKTAVCAGATPFVEKLSATRPDPLMQLTARELLAVLDEEVARLPAVQRSAVILCCLEGHAREEAATMLGCSPGSLKGHLERGRRRLQAQLQRRGVALSAALALVTVSRVEALSALLLRNTVKAALGGGSSATPLAHSVLQSMLMAKVAGALAVTLAIVLAASTAIALVYRGPVTEAPEYQKPSDPVASKDAGTSKPQARIDALGDPLPEGAIARLGTVRFRHGGDISFLRFTPDEKRLVSKGIDGVRVWDSATGKEVWHLPLAPDTKRGTVDLSPDGKILAALVPGPGNPIDLWDVDNGKKVGSLSGKFQPPLRFSPDGKWLAAGTGGTEVELWDLAGKKKLRAYDAHDGSLRYVEFFADSRRMLAGDIVGKVHFWDTASGKKLLEIEPLSWDPAFPSPDFYHVPVLCADGKLLAILEARVRALPEPVAEPKATISVWDTATGKLVRQLSCPSQQPVPGFVNPFHALFLAPDGKTLVTSGPDSFIRLWDPATGHELRRVQVEGDSKPLIMALSRDGQTLATVSDWSTILIRDMKSGKPKLSPGGRMSTVYGAILTPDGRTAITGGLDDSLIVWDATAGRIERHLGGHERFNQSLQLSVDGRTVYCSNFYNALHVWDLASGKEQRRIKVEPYNLWTRLNPIVCPDGKNLIVADRDRERIIHVLDMATERETRQFRLERLSGMVLTADGRTLVGCSSNGLLRLWDVASGRTLRDCPLPVIEDGVQYYSIAISPDGRLLVVGRPHGIGAELPKKRFLLLVDMASGKEIYRRDDWPRGVDNLVFSPDGHTLAWGGFNEPTIRLLETATLRERRTFTGHRGAVTSLAFSADGRRLISGSFDTTSLVWDLSDHVRSAGTKVEIESLWGDLASQDAALAYRSMQQLAASPSLAIPFMRDRIRPVDAVEENRSDRLLAALDSEDFATRQKASEELAAFGEQALNAYDKALKGKPSLEMRRRLEELQTKAREAWWFLSAERLRSLRAIETLELMGTPQAREVLVTLATGAEGARLTEEARAALKRSQR